MSARNILVLGILALAVLVLALVLAGRMPSGTDVEGGGALVPDLREQVNEIDAIDITDAEGNLAVRLRRERERWRVQEKSDYEADFELVQALLRDLATARRAEERTSNPEWYSRLGVADPGTPDSAGVMVSFPGTDLPEVILGEPDSAGIGRYARVRGEERSWLIDAAPEIPDNPLDWLERAIMNIPARELAEISIRHPDGQTVRLRPAGDDNEQWVLLNVPEGREAAPAWEIRPIAGALTALNLEDVRPHDSIPDDAVRSLYRTADGLNFVISLFADERGHWVHFSVSPELEALAADDMDEAATQLAIDAAAVDGRLSPWQFAIPQRRWENMTRQLGDLLADPE